MIHTVLATSLSWQINKHVRVNRPRISFYTEYRYELNMAKRTASLYRKGFKFVKNQSHVKIKNNNWHFL